MTTATITIQKNCQSKKSVNCEENGDRDLVRQSQVLKLSRDTCAPTRSMMPVSADLNFWRHSCWSFITPDQQTRHHSAIIVESNIPGTRALQLLSYAHLIQ